MTDSSSTALLPQLTDLLRALTDSQELLLTRVRSVRQLSAMPLVVENPKVEFLQPVDLRLPAAVAPTTTKDEHRAHPLNEIESSTGPRWLTPSEPDVNPSVAATTTSQITWQESPVPTCATTGASTSALETNLALPAQAPAPPESRLISHADTTDADSVNRNYNFFDELDAKLARLRDLKSDSAEH